MTGLTHWFFRLVKCRACGARHRGVLTTCPFEKRPLEGA